MNRNLAPIVITLFAAMFLGESISQAFAQDAGTTPASSTPGPSRYIIVRSIKPGADARADQGQSQRVINYGVKYADLDRLLATVPNIKQVVPTREIFNQARHLNRSLDVRIVGTVHDYAASARLELDRGRFLTEADNAKYKNCVVIAAKTAQALFVEEDPIGQAIKCGTDYYTIVGVTRWRPAGNEGDGKPATEAFDNDVYIPLNTCRLRFGERIMNSRTGSRVFEETQLSELVVHLRDQAGAEATAALIKSVLEPFHPMGDVSITIRRHDP